MLGPEQDEPVALKRTVLSVAVAPPGIAAPD